MNFCGRFITSAVHPAGFTLALSIPMVVGFLMVPRQHPAARVPRLVGGHVLVVGPGNISTIQDAVDQAVDGDSILIKGGNYPGFAIINKDLRVVADEGATVNVLGQVSVTRLADGKIVLLAGLVIEWQNFEHPGSGALSTYNDLGHLRVQECTIRGFQGFGYGEGGVRIDSSSDVCLSSCSVEAGDQAYYVNGPPGIAAVGSTVAIYDSNLQGGMGGYGYCGSGGPAGPGGPGGAAYEQTESSPSFVFLSGSSLFGGAGGIGGYFLCDCDDQGTAGGNGGDGGPCVEQIGSSPNPISVATLELSLHPGQGGPGGQGGNQGLCANGQPAGAPGHSGPQFVLPGQQLQQLGGSSRKFLTPRVARANATATLSCYGVPGDTYQVFLSPALEFTYLPSMHGVQLVQLPSAQLIASGTVPPNGLFAPMIMLPPLDGADCRPLYLQAYVRDSNSQRFICTQMTLLEVDPRF